MRKVAFISTGGTIAMSKGDNEGAVPTAGAKELLDLIDGIRDKIQIDEFEFINIPSAHMGFEELVKMKELIEEQILPKDYDGIVITHGTDTMEETAYFLDLTIDTDIPIIVTGSQRNLSAVSSDVARNLLDSLMVAADENAKNRGTMIVFSSEIITAREALKTHRTRLDTFKSIEFGPIGTVDNDRVLWFRDATISEVYGLGNIKDIDVNIIPAYLGADSRTFYNDIEDNISGIVLQSLGAGHIPEKMLPGIEKAIENNIPVVLTSRTLYGRFFTNTYGFKGSESYLRKIGVIFGEDLTSQKVRIKLFVLLSLGYSMEEIKREFEKNYYI